MNSNLDLSADSIDLGRILRLILLQSKLIFFVTIFFTSLGIANYLLSEKTYKINSLLQVYSDQSSSLSGPLSVDLFGSNSSTTDLENLKNLYKSRTNILQIIDANMLNVVVNNDDQRFKTYIKQFSVNLAPDTEFYEFELVPKNDSFTLISSNGEIYDDLSYDYKNENDFFVIDISKPSSEFMKSIDINFFTKEALFKKLQNDLVVSKTLSAQNYYGRRDTGLFEVSIVSSRIDEALKVINYANELYITNSIKFESEKANKALEFIEQRITSVQRKLDLDKENLRNFRQQNLSVNVDLEIESILDNISLLEQRISELDIEISRASNNYTTTNPFYLELLNEREVLVGQKNKIQDEIKELPLAQQNFIDLFRNVEISEQVYTELLNKRLEYSIREASTLGNIRVIDPAYLDIQVGPRLLNVFILGFIGLVLSLIVAIFRGLYFLAITNPAELADGNIFTPVVSVVPKLNESSEDDSERFNQSLESLIMNADNFVGPKKSKIIGISSATPSNGKSFITRSLSKKLSSLGFKTLLIDADWKRGDQHKVLNLEKIKKADFENLDENTIENYKVDNNFYVVPKVTGLSNSFQMIYSNSFTDLINNLKEKFDYIIFDTAPALSVSDTAIILGICDTNFFVVRHDVTKINEIKQTLSLVDQLGVKFDGIVYNAYEKPGSYYGYYGLYGNYSYQYYANKYLYESYNYDKDDS